MSTIACAAMPPSIMIQYGVLLTILDILEFSSKFYLISNVRSDSENDSYIRDSRGMQLLTVRFCIILEQLCRYDLFSQCDAERQPVMYSTVQYVPPKRVMQKEDLASVAIVAGFVYGQCAQFCY